MKTNAKYLILFPALTFASVSFDGNQNIIYSNSHFSNSISIDDIALKKYSFCTQGTTAVFITKPIQVNEAEVKNEMAYKEKLNTLTETVHNFLKIKLKKGKQRI